MRITSLSATPSSWCLCSLIGTAQIFYANNATNISAETALTTSWIGPSITPLTNLNSGFRVYEVDSAVRVYLHPRFPLNLNCFVRHSKFWMLTRKPQFRLFREMFKVVELQYPGGEVTSAHSPISMGRRRLVPRMYTSTILVRLTARVSGGGVRTTH